MKRNAGGESNLLSTFSLLDLSNEKSSRFSCGKILRVLCAYFMGRYREKVRLKKFSVLLSFIYHMNSTFSVIYILQCINLSMQYGGLIVLFIFIVMTLVVSVPLGHIFSFLGNYSGRAHCRIWEMVPMLKGISYSITFLTILKLCAESIISSLYFYMFTTTIFDDPWKDCYYERNCKDKIVINDTCTGSYELSPRVKINTAEYSKEITWKKGSLEFNWNYTLWLLLTWALIFVLISMKIKYEKVMVFMGNLFFAILTVIFMSYIIIFFMPEIEVISTKFEGFFYYKVWVDVAIFTIQNDLPFVWLNLYYTKHSPEKFKQNIRVLAAIKIFTVFIIISNIPYVVGSHRFIYDSKGCIFVSGYYLVISVVPVALHSKNSQLGNIYFFWNSTLSLLSIITNIRLLQIGIFDRFPTVYRLRNLIKLLFCVASCFLAIMQLYFSIDVGLHEIQSKLVYISTTILFLLTVIGVAIYRLRRIQGDYYYMLKKEFPSTANIRRIYFTATVICIWFCIDMWNNTTTDLYILYATVGIISLPLLFLPLLYLSKSCASSSKWGMPSAFRKRERRMLNINISTTFRKNFQCNHVCLRNDPQLLKEIG